MRYPGLVCLGNTYVSLLGHFQFRGNPYDHHIAGKHPMSNPPEDNLLYRPRAGQPGKII